jgi:ubiquinone biosynthesis protein UbiJ
VEAFLAGVDKVRDDAERLEARFRRVAQKAAP